MAESPTSIPCYFVGFSAAERLFLQCIPQLWVLAGEDREAPGSVTRERLVALKHEGKPIDLYVFPHTDHGMYEFVQDADGSRHVTRITDGYFHLLADWIRQRQTPPYGRGEPVR